MKPATSPFRRRQRARAHERGSRMKKKNIGSTFDSWLQEEGIYEEASANAVKHVMARQITCALSQEGLSSEIETA